MRHGLAVAVDYGHTAPDRPPYGSLRSYLRGRRWTCSRTGRATSPPTSRWTRSRPRTDARLLRQGDALRALGVSGRRPDLALAGTDPAGYVASLSRAGEAAELTEETGLGGFWWMVSAAGVPQPFDA